MGPGGASGSCHLLNLMSLALVSVLRKFQVRGVCRRHHQLDPLYLCSKDTRLLLYEANKSSCVCGIGIDYGPRQAALTGDISIPRHNTKTHLYTLITEASLCRRAETRSDRRGVNSFPMVQALSGGPEYPRPVCLCKAQIEIVRERGFCPCVG